MFLFWYSSPSLMSRLIRRLTRSSYSHVAIMVDGVLYEAVGSGILAHRAGAAWQRAHEAISYAHVPAREDDERRVTAWLNAQVGHGYSILGALAAGLASVGIFKLVIALKGEYICSGLVGTALQIAGYIPTVDARLETPASLAEIFQEQIREMPR